MIVNNWIILGSQSTVGLVVYTLIFFWCVQPSLSKLPFEKAVLPLLLLHVFRFAGFALLVVGQVDPSLPRQVMSAIAYGDLLAGISALIAAIALRGLAQSMARELAPKNIHVAHFIIDGSIASPYRPQHKDKPDSFLEPDAIAQSYLNTLLQHRSAWTWEIELRPWVERF